mgnify:CR=1 FL=1
MNPTLLLGYPSPIDSPRTSIFNTTNCDHVHRTLIASPAMLPRFTTPSRLWFHRLSIHNSSAAAVRGIPSARTSTKIDPVECTMRGSASRRRIAEAAKVQSAMCKVQCAMLEVPSSHLISSQSLVHYVAADFGHSPNIRRHSRVERVMRIYMYCLVA